MYFHGVAKDKHAALLTNVDTEHHRGVPKLKSQVIRGWLK